MYLFTLSSEKCRFLKDSIHPIFSISSCLSLNFDAFKFVSKVIEVTAESSRFKGVSKLIKEISSRFKNLFESNFLLFMKRGSLRILETLTILSPAT